MKSYYICGCEDCQYQRYNARQRKWTLALSIVLVILVVVLWRVAR